MTTDDLSPPTRITYSIRKERVDDPDYLVIEEGVPSWHDPDGSEITDPARLAALEAEHQRKAEPNGTHDNG